MVRLNIHEAKTRLSVYLKRVAKGESILLCSRNTPVAEIHPLPAARKTKRPLGLAKGAFKVPEEFFKPLSASVVKAFRGIECAPPAPRA